MAIPVVVQLDRVDQSPLDLTPLIEPGSLTWSSVVPGGFASCSFQVNGDFRRLVKQIPFLSIVRVVADSGRVLFEGQVEDLAPTLSDTVVGVKVGAYGLQNLLKEQTVRQIWSKRDMQWTEWSALPGVTFDGTRIRNINLHVSTGNFDQTNIAKSGVQVAADGTSAIPANNGNGGEWVLPIGTTIVRWVGSCNQAGTDAGTTKWGIGFWSLNSGTWTTHASGLGGAGVSSFSVTLTSAATALRVGVFNASGAGATPAASDVAQFYDQRVFGLVSSEDATGGFFGGTLINSLLGQVSGIGAGVIESGSDFTVDHLDASVRRAAYDILQEVAGYYAREWAVWENALLDWRTPNLQQNQWVVPLAVLTGLDLDASVQNSQRTSYVLYTDAASQVTGESSSPSTDRRNPYVLRGRAKDNVNDVGLTMTSSTSAQLASVILQDLGFGPVPAAGSITLPGETILQHASGTSKKAWEVRAGDNVTLPELPLADVFTQDGRGEILFHVVSAEAATQDGTVTLSLDSYGSKRSDVLLARLAAVTSALGG